MSNQRTIPFGRPWVTDEDRLAVLEVLQGNILTHGPQCHAFEQEFAAFMGSEGHCITMSSCMAALHIAFFHFGIGPRDEVIAPAMTHVATVHSIELVGARPVFVDADPLTGNITAQAVAQAVTPRTKAVALVHYLGIPCDMGPIMDVANAHGLKVIEDCALAVGSRYQDIHVGLWGDVGCYSFYPVKHITTGEGGMLVSKDRDTAKSIARKRAFGVDRSHTERKVPGHYDVVELGLNYRMSEMQAALGRTQVKKLPEILRRRNENFRQLKEMLGALAGVRVLDAQSPDVHSSHYCLSMVLLGDLAARRNKVVAALNVRGVGTSIYYPQPVPRMTYYQNKYSYNAALYPVATQISDGSIALPVGPHLDGDDMTYIAEHVTAVLHQFL